MGVKLPRAVGAHAVEPQVVAVTLKKYMAQRPHHPPPLTILVLVIDALDRSADFR